MGGFVGLVGSWNYWKSGRNFQGNHVYRHEAEPIDTLGTRILYYMLGEFDLIEVPANSEENDIECAVEFIQEAPNLNLNRSHPPPVGPFAQWNAQSGLAYWQEKQRVFSEDELAYVWKKYRDRLSNSARPNPSPQSGR